MKSIPYLTAVEALMYLATTTRPNIFSAVGVLARLGASPSPTKWLTVKHVLRWLKGTANYRLELEPDPSTSKAVTSRTMLKMGFGQRLKSATQQ